MPQRPPLPRLLLIEDSDARWNVIRSWVPANGRLVWAKSAGEALGLLAHDGGRTYAGILLDYNLHMMRPGETKTGRDVAVRIVERVSPTVPILVHSMNEEHRGEMIALLTAGGFEVTQIPMEDLDRQSFDAWLETVNEIIQEEDD